MNLEPKPLHEIINFNWISEYVQYYRIHHTDPFPKTVNLLTIKQYMKLLNESNIGTWMQTCLRVDDVFYVLGLSFQYDSSRIGWPCKCGALFEKHDELCCPYIFYTPIDNLGYCQWLEDQKKKA